MNQFLLPSLQRRLRDHDRGFVAAGEHRLDQHWLVHTHHRLTAALRWHAYAHVSRLASGQIDEHDHLVSETAHGFEHLSLQ
jgi:hypothetical protein